jgi:hypothetical protein
LHRFSRLLALSVVGQVEDTGVLAGTAALTGRVAGSGGGSPLLELWSAPTVERVYVVRSGDGSVWARGRNWKASISATKSAFIPFFGSAAPMNFPVRFSLESIHADEGELASTTPASVSVEGHRVSIPRGSVAEVYDLHPDGVGQMFALQERSSPGDIVVRVGIESELAPSALEEGGFRFSNDYGEVRYGRAESFDAEGRRRAVAASLEGGRIEFREPGDFVESAVIPATTMRPPSGLDSTSTEPGFEEHIPRLSERVDLCELESERASVSPCSTQEPRSEGIDRTVASLEYGSSG